ncbi:MAG: putative membrane protein YfcA [Acidimicrobiales bacterium]|jgi:uncharacterized membrane protein YfcA
MFGMDGLDAVLIFAGGVFAGLINSMAGGGSLLTVPLLSLGGVEGLLANGTNRVAVLIQNASSGYGYAKRGIGSKAETLQVLVPTLVGGLVGAAVVSQIDDKLFERIFGFLMIPLLALSIWKPKTKSNDEPWPMWVTAVVFFGVGIYAGAIQAGVGLILLLVLSRAGFDLVKANAIKTFVILGVSVVAVAIFVAQGQVRWGPAAVLSAGMAIGGYGGSQLAVTGGEKLIKPVLVVSVLALAGRMIGVY